MPLLSSMNDMRKIPARMGRSIMKSHRVQIPKYEMPIRLRPWFLAFTCIIMVLLGFLGFTNFSRSLPLNDKLLHFLCFCIATIVFYFIVDVEESSRRIWFWRYSGLIFTTITCGFFGGIMSEVVQSALPYKVFDWGDIFANLLGSTLGLVVAYYLERYYRHRREARKALLLSKQNNQHLFVQQIARLYRPISSSYSDLEEDEEDIDSTQLLPTHNGHTQAKHAGKSTRLTDVWDEREELFDIGDGDDENDQSQLQVGHSLQRPEMPRIVISHL